MYHLVHQEKVLHIDLCLVLICISIIVNFNIFIYSFFFSIIVTVIEMSLLDFLFRPKYNRLFQNLLYALTDAEYDV